MKTRIPVAGPNETRTECSQLMQKIVMVRQKSVMIDRDLADMYQVSTKRLNEQVKRNIERFPERFRFCLTDGEKSEVVANCVHLAPLRFSHAPVYAFTEQGVAMLATVLKSSVAVKASIDIMDAFVAMRCFMISSVGVLQRIGAIELRQLETDRRVDTVFAALDRGNLLPNGIFPADSEFDAYCDRVARIGGLWCLGVMPVSGFSFLVLG